MSDFQPASRDIAAYLAKKPKRDHILVSVAKGLGFLHLVTPQTQRLFLLDPQSVYQPYCSLVISAITNSEDVFEFLSKISGYEVTKENMLLPECLTGSHQDGMFTPYQSNVVYFDEPNIECENEQVTYSWYFGPQFAFSSFRSDDRFQELKKRLIDLPIYYLCESPETIDYQYHVKTDQYPLYVFLSDEEQLFGNLRDPIVNRLYDTAPPNIDIVIHSWSRTLIRTGDKIRESMDRIFHFTRDEDIYQTSSFGGYSYKQSDLGCRSLKTGHVKKSDDMNDIPAFSTFLYLMSLKNPAISVNRHALSSFLNVIPSKFKRLIIIDQSRFLSFWFEMLSTIGFFRTYIVTHLDSLLHGERFIMVMELRGFYPWQVQ